MGLNIINRNINMTPAQIRDSLLSLPDNERKFIISNPGTGEHRVFELRRNADGNPEYDYNTEPES